ncbi:MAG: hypothetical protein ACAH83_09690, partial [Alphaproteobacteria bacterium]
MGGQQLSPSELDTAITAGHDLAEASKAWKAQYKQTGQAPDGFEGIKPLDPKTIGTDPDSFQFRPECGPTGVCAGQEIKGPYDYGRAGIALIFETNEGSRFIVDGHHRLDYAKKHPEENITLYSDVLREKEGWSKPMARAIGAMKNLQEGSTSVQEVAESLGITADALKERWQRNLGEPVPPPKIKAPEKAPEPVPGVTTTPAQEKPSAFVRV